MYGRLEGPRLARPAAEPPKIRQDRPRPLEHVHTTTPQPYSQPQPQIQSHSQSPFQPHGQLHHHSSHTPLSYPTDFVRHSSRSPRPHSQPPHPLGPPPLIQSHSPHNRDLQQQQQQRPSSTGSVGDQKVEGQMNLLAELALSHDRDDPRQAPLGFPQVPSPIPARSSSASWNGERHTAVESSRNRTMTLPPIASITSMAATPAQIAAAGLGVYAPHPSERDMRPHWLASSGFTSESPRERPGSLRRSNTEKQPSVQDGGVKLRYNVRAYSRDPKRAQPRQASINSNLIPTSLTTRDPLPDAVSRPSQRHLSSSTASPRHNASSPNPAHLHHPLESVTLDLDYSGNTVDQWHQEAQHLLHSFLPPRPVSAHQPNPDPTPPASGATSPIKVLSPHEVRWERTGSAIGVPRDSNGKLVHPPPPAQGSAAPGVENRTASGKTRRRSSEGSRKTGSKCDPASPRIVDGQMQYKFVEVSQDELRAPYYQSRSKIDRLGAENGEVQAPARESRPTGRSTEAGKRDRSQGRWAPYPPQSNGHHYWRQEELNEPSASMLDSGTQNQPFLLDSDGGPVHQGVMHTSAGDSRSLQSAQSDETMALATTTPSGLEDQAARSPSPAQCHTGDHHLPMSSDESLDLRERRASGSMSSSSSQYTTDDHSVIATRSLPASLLRQRLLSPIVRSKTEPPSPCPPLTTGSSPTGSYNPHPHPASSVEPPLKRLRLTDGASSYLPDESGSQDVAANDSLRTLVDKSETSVGIDKPSRIGLPKRERTDRVHPKRFGPRRRAQNAKAQKKFRDKKRLAGKQMEQALQVAQMKNEASQAKIEALERRLREFEKAKEAEERNDGHECKKNRSNENDGGREEGRTLCHTE